MHLLHQLELQLEDAEAPASEDEIAAEEAAAKTTTVASFERRRRGGRKPFPEQRGEHRTRKVGAKAHGSLWSSDIRRVDPDHTASAALFRQRSAMNLTYRYGKDAHVIMRDHRDPSGQIATNASQRSS